MEFELTTSAKRAVKGRKQKTPRSTGSGAPAIAGYEYQIDVSVWLALDLVLASGMTSNLILEPASQEDLEATLSEYEPGRLASLASMGDYDLIVQAKLDNGDAWTQTTLVSLLQYGSEARVSAAARLEASTKNRYLLVTSAGVNGPAKALCKRFFGTWPGLDAVPEVISKRLEFDISSRFAVIANQDAERLVNDIENLLTNRFRVPNSKLQSCRKQLREDARSRIGGASGGRWTRAELETVIRAHDGILASTPELENYVHPTNWNDLLDAMKRKSAAIIVGQSGTGKTLATKKLYDELRQSIPGLTRVPIRFGPYELRDNVTPAPVLFDIEDPWGRFDFDPKSRPWNDQLASILSSARPDSLIVATSRLDVAKASGAFKAISPWVVPLESENYGKPERQRLFRTRLSSLPQDVQELVRDSEQAVLSKLATPLEIQKFFDAIRTAVHEPGIDSNDLVDIAIDMAHEDSIERTVIEQIQERNDVRAATVIWALLDVNQKVTRALLREIEAGLSDIDSEMASGISPLIDFFVSARNLRQSDDGVVTYYHPRVEAGITTALKEHELVVRKTLRNLIELLAASNELGLEWGPGVAARLVARSRKEFNVSPGPNASLKIDAWLERRLEGAGSDFDAYLKLTSAAGSPACNVAEVARFLMHRVTGDFAGLYMWADPEYTPEWFRHRQEAPSTKPLIERFIREVMAGDQVYYPRTFADDLGRLASGLDSAFLDAAVRSVGYGVISSDDAIAYGALKDVDDFGAVVDLAVEALTPSASQVKKAKATLLDIQNEVYSEDYASYLSENDEGYTASEYLKAFVRRARETKGWLYIVKHKHADHMRNYWVSDVSEAGRTSNEAEFDAAFEVAFGTEDERDLWIALRKDWSPKFSDALQFRVVEGNERPGISIAALTCILEHDISAFRKVLVKLETESASNRLIEICREILEMPDLMPSEEESHILDLARGAASALPSPFHDFVVAETATAQKTVPTLSDEAVEVLSEILNPSEHVRELRLMLDAHIPLPVESDIEHALSRSEDSAIAILAIQAAIRHGMTTVVEAALDHRFAHIAALALTAVADSLSGPFPHRILILSTHRASPVRLALAVALKRNTSVAHTGTLMALANDHWSKDSFHYYDQSSHCPIARVAVEALADLAPFGPEYDTQMQTIAKSTTDLIVRSTMLELMAASGPPTQQLLFDLAVDPGRAAVHAAAANALLSREEYIDDQMLAQISSEHLNLGNEEIALIFALLLGHRGTIAVVQSVAEAISADKRRRVLLLPILVSLRDRDMETAKKVADLLPKNHPAVRVALGIESPVPTYETLADLGDPALCDEVLKVLLIGNRGLPAESPATTPGST